jgi:hypothetical protein
LIESSPAELRGREPTTTDNGSTSSTNHHTEQDEPTPSISHKYVLYLEEKL